MLSLAFALAPLALALNTSYNDADLMTLSLQWQQFNQEFISQGLANFTAQDFESGQYPAPSWGRPRIEQLLQHAQVRVNDSVTLLNQTLPSCKYKIPQFPSAYLWTSYLCGIKQLAASGYIGIMPYLEDPGNKLVIASTLSDEARAQAFVYGPIFKGPMWTGAYDTYVSPDELYSLMTLFQACDTSLPFTVSPPLLFNGNPIGYDGFAGDSVRVTWGNGTVGTGYLSLANGLTHELIPIQNGNITVPEVQGWTWATLTNASSIEDYTRDSIIAGPGFIHVDFNSTASNPGLPPTPLVLQGNVP